jgi:glutamate-ammonia-ligase adenylyltransferase
MRDALRAIRESPDRVPGILEGHGFDDPVSSARVLRDLAALLPETRHDLLAVVPTAPDPDRALRNLHLLLAAAADTSDLAAQVLEVPEGAWTLATVLGSSQSLAGVLLAEPEQAPVLIRPGPPPDREDLRRELLAAIDGADEDAVLRALRRHRGRHLGRILVDDLCRAAPLEVVTRRISDVAEDLIEGALTAAARDLVDPVPGFAVLAMGKLGGGELNYASDVDLIFVHASPEDREMPGAWRETYTELAERLCRLLSRKTADGFALRVDMRLRPEGSRGPLVRTLASTLEYYRTRARTWERQALIKLRPVAGDRALGRLLTAKLEPVVYDRGLDTAGIRAIQENKERIEERVAGRGGEGGEVKEGRGGIRDIEFTVQFLQLLNGREHPRVRCPGTLSALRRLEEVGALSGGERRRLERTYRFLRNVEHRLQTMHETPVRRLPGEERELARLARRLDPRAADEDPAGTFTDRYRRLTEGARAILDRLVHAPFRDRGRRASGVVDAILDPKDEATAVGTMTTFGFRDPTGALRTLRALAKEESPYLPRIRQFFASAAPALLRRVEATVDPDETLRRFERLVNSLGGKNLLFQMLAENPDVLDVLVDLCGGSAFLTDLVAANPAMFDPFLESLVVVRRAGWLPFEDLPVAESLAEGPELARDLHVLRDLEMVRVGIRDLQGLSNVRNVMEDLTRLAERILDLALTALSRPLFARKGEPRREDGKAGRFAVLGLGRLGARELVYGSDLDVVFVHDAGGTTSRGLGSPLVLTDLAQQLIRTLGGHSAYGRLYRVDARLRPEGAGGPLVPSLDAFGRHLREGAELWEKLALTRARAVGGDPGLGRELEEAIVEALYAKPPAPDRAAEVVRMRGRQEEETEGLDLKRGSGGLADIEFLAGWLQLRHGRDCPAARTTNVCGALTALREADLLDAVRHEMLLSAYQLLRKVESRLRIVYNRPLARIPEGGEERDELARRLGYGGGTSSPGQVLEDELRYFMKMTRNLFEEILAP